MSEGTIAIAMRKIYENALVHANYQPRPDFAMLAQEVLELSLALRGRHEHSPEYELVQLGGIIANWLGDIEEASPGAVIDTIVPPKIGSVNGSLREPKMVGEWENQSGSGK